MTALVAGAPSRGGSWLRRRGQATIPFRLTVLLIGATGSVRAEEDIVARSRAAYAALVSYSDTAVVEIEIGTRGGPLLRERHTFATRFREPRHFFFELIEDEAAGGDRFVVWSDEQAFKTWWKTTGVEETDPPGRGVAALVTAFGVTNGAAAIVTPLLFPQTDLKGPLLDFAEGVLEGTESIGGRECHRMKGVQRPVYANTGRVGQVRDTTLWIDAEAFLLCRVFEDTPRGSPAGSVQRVTTTFKAQANPALADEAFRFVRPAN